jgi:hypothetical protein
MRFKFVIRVSMLLVWTCALTRAQNENGTLFFPKGVFGTIQQGGDIKAKWYTKILTALDERPLVANAHDGRSPCVYRFLWIRTFHNPVSVRLTVKAEGEGVVTTRMSDGRGGYDTGRLTLNRTRPVSREEVQSFLVRLRDLSFWSMPSEDDGGVEDSRGYRLKTSGLDGARWVLEGIKDGEYHVVDRWSPEYPGESVASREYGQICRYLLKLGRVDVDEKDIY